MDVQLIEEDGTQKIVNKVKAKIAEKDAIIDTLSAENAELLDALKQMKMVTSVLGKGIAHISVPDNFFYNWNEAEVKSSALIAKHEAQ